MVQGTSHLEDQFTFDDALNRRPMARNSFWRFFMHLPKAPETNFVVRPDQPLPDKIVDEQFYQIWTKEELKKLETDLTSAQEEGIRNGIPTMAMAAVAKNSMRWNKLIQGGLCSGTYANDKFILQLTNSTIVAVLLSGFSTAALLQTPNFEGETQFYKHPLPLIMQAAYSLFMLSSTMYCFAATGIALHSVNRLSNVLPSKTAVSYMSLTIFFKARDSVNDYVFKGMASGCLGIIVAVVWNSQNIFYGIPAAIVCIVATIWFVAVYKNWEKMSTFHSDIGDKLCAKDLEIAARGKNSVTESLWTV